MKETNLDDQYFKRQNSKKQQRKELNVIMSSGLTLRKKISAKRMYAFT